MTTSDTKRPEILLTPGGIYVATDPITGKTLTSPSYVRLAEQIGATTSARDRAAAEQAERDELKAEGQQAGAARLAELTPRLQAAEQARDDAHERFRHEALTGGPFGETFAAYLAAFHRHDALRLQAIDARYLAQHGHDKPGGGASTRPPTLAEALDRVVTARAIELRTTAVEA